MVYPELFIFIRSISGRCQHRNPIFDVFRLIHPQITSFAQHALLVYEMNY